MPNDEDVDEIKPENGFSTSTEGLGVEICQREKHRSILEKDVAALFEDSDSVNYALRMLIGIAEKVKSR